MLAILRNLATMGVPIHSVMDQLFESKPMAYFSMIQSGLDHWYIDPHYPFGIVTIPYGLEGKSPNSPIDFFRQLTDTELMVLCKEILPNEFKISFRSRSTLNVATFNVDRLRKLILNSLGRISLHNTINSVSVNCRKKSMGLFGDFPSNP